MSTPAPGSRRDEMPTVAIVGAGFAGTATAVQLLRQARRPLSVCLINESGRMARGLAYGTSSTAHLLNVPAGNMSALAGDETHFLRHAQAQDASRHAGSFVPRAEYGEYLEALLGSAERDALARGGRLQRRVAQVRSVQPLAPPGSPGGWQLALHDGSTLTASRVVLAFGHFAPSHPLPAPARHALGAAYVADPWRSRFAQQLAPDAAVLLVGSGLTAVDMLLSLLHAGHRGPVHIVSRRGLAPQPHRVAAIRPTRVDAAAAATLLQLAGPTLRGQLRALRRAVQAAAREGIDWRDWIGALRPHTPSWWQALTVADRRRFLRHLQVFWDTHRHRVAPEAFAAFDAARASGRVRLMAARLVGADPAAGRVAVQLRPRGSAAVRTLSVDLVVNCTAPSSRLADAGSPLVQGLLEAGHLVPDALGLGLEAGPLGELVGRDGSLCSTLRYIGPLLKARDWEGTAVPELRVHARHLAQALLHEMDLLD